MAEQVRKTRGGRTTEGSPLRDFSREGGGDSGGYKSGDQTRSGDQSGLVTLEWIILVAAVTGIVTMALLVGWDALWNRSDELSEDDGRGYQLSARRAAAEVTSGLACSLLNALYTGNTGNLKWVADTDEPADTDKCTCEITSDATAEVCAPQTLDDARTETFAKNDSARTIDVSALFFSESPALTYEVLPPLPDANVARVSISAGTSELTITPTSGGEAGTETATVQVTDSNTSYTATAAITIHVEDDCKVKGEERPVYIGDFEGEGNNVFAIGDSKVVFLRDHLKTGFNSSGDLDPDNADFDPTNASATRVHDEWIEISIPPLSQAIQHDQTREREHYPIIAISALLEGTNKLTVEGTYCDEDSFSLPIYIVVGRVKTPISAKTYSTSPQTYDFAGNFNHLSASAMYTHKVLGDNPDADMTVTLSGTELTFTKAAGVSDAVTRTIKVTATDNGVQLHTEFDVTFS